MRRTRGSLNSENTLIVLATSGIDKAGVCGTLARVFMAPKPSATERMIWHILVDSATPTPRSDGIVFARKIQVDVLGPGDLRACPLAWLDSYCMRSFTGRSAFDETLPVADGQLEASFRVDLQALRADMEDWMTRKFGKGRKIKLRLTEKGGAVTSP